MTLDSLDKGDKTEIHLRLYESELTILDALAQRHNCSRAMIIGALLDDVHKTDKHLAGVQPGKRRPVLNHGENQ